MRGWQTPEKGVRKDERDCEREKPEELQCRICQLSCSSMMILHRKIFGFFVYDLIEDATLMHDSKPIKRSGSAPHLGG